MIKLRPYQEDAKAGIFAAWARAIRAVLLVMPTGSGKTRTFASIIHDHVGCSAAVVHRKEIVAQIAMALADLEVKHRVVGPDKLVARIRRMQLKQYGKSFIDPHAKCGVISVQTLTSKASGNDRELQAWLHQVTLCVYDEGHHYTKNGFWARAVECMKNAKLLFVTATPERADGKGLGAHADGFCEEMIVATSTKWLIDEGFLSKFKYHAPQTDLRLEDIPITAGGELNAKALRARVVDSSLVGDVVRQYRQFADGLQTIVFADCIDTALELERAFIAAGYTAKALSGETESGERDAAIDSYAAGKTQLLVNVDLFDEGFDVPSTVAVILARPTESVAKYLQQVGRALRTAPGKDHAIVIDPVRNWERHGMPTFPRAWALDGRQKGAQKVRDTVPQRTCLNPMCCQPYEAFYKACPYCGTVPEPAERKTPEQVDGELGELDVEAMNALFDRYRQANKSPEEYAREQIARGIPAIGRGPDMRRHQAALHRRDVLKELVAWWWGCQPADRAEGEKQRRFFHRFGVDVMTAFTLNEAETDSLIVRISAKFALDVAAS